MKVVTQLAFVDVQVTSDSLSRELYIPSKLSIREAWGGPEISPDVTQSCNDDHNFNQLSSDDLHRHGAELQITGDIMERPLPAMPRRQDTIKGGRSGSPAKDHGTWH